MKKLSQLKEGDILYEYDLNKKFLNILYVIKPNYYAEQIEYTPLVVSDQEEYGIDEDGTGIVLWFPEYYDLDKAILVHYYDNIWSIFSTNYDVIASFVGKTINLNEVFETALDMFEQYEINLRKDHIYIDAITE